MSPVPRTTVVVVIGVAVIMLAGLFRTPGCGVPPVLAHLGSRLQLSTAEVRESFSELSSVDQQAQDGLRWGGYGPTGAHILIDGSSLQLSLRFGAEELAASTVAVGKASTPTPKGIWIVVDKAVWGGAFGARWMGMSVPWGRYGIHGTNRPGSIGYNASAGCVRMFNRDVTALYRVVPVGTLVVITGPETGRFGDSPRTIKYGSRGTDVMQLQRVLMAENLYGGSIDGVFGYGTLSALREYGVKRDLSPDVWEQMELAVVSMASRWFLIE